MNQQSIVRWTSSLASSEKSNHIHVFTTTIARVDQTIRKYHRHQAWNQTYLSDHRAGITGINWMAILV
jgi:hypothetical protein